MSLTRSGLPERLNPKTYATTGKGNCQTLADKLQAVRGLNLSITYGSAFARIAGAASNWASYAPAAASSAPCCLRRRPNPDTWLRLAGTRASRSSTASGAVPFSAASSRGAAARSSRHGDAELSKVRMLGKTTRASTPKEGAHTQASQRPNRASSARLRLPSAQWAWHFIQPPAASRSWLAVSFVVRRRLACDSTLSTPAARAALAPGRGRAGP